ncbi:MAG: prolipoprotein diacylglyceryl transferase [Deltaproteobacteria bacterium]|nr:prolipoprotein diacylglyceryl transferase [Deltaproteobacteria bacterium]
MLPCLRDVVKIPPLFGVVPIQPFGVLVGIGLVVGYLLARRRAKATGLDPDLCADGMVWTVVVGFVVAHWVSVVFYFPHRIAENPLVLLAFWSGLSSFGGFVGGLLGAYWYFARRRKVSLLEYADAIIFGLMPGWIFGRLGCTVVHDHPGRPTSFFMGVKCGALPEHDLGLYEMLYTIVLTGVLYALKGVRPFPGFHPGLMMLLYAPVRFALDYLRVEDKTYLGFTPGQYSAVLMGAAGIALMAYGRHVKNRPAKKEPARTKPAKARGR